MADTPLDALGDAPMGEWYERALYDSEIARHLLALREALIRHDENEKALVLMEDCVPFFLENRDPGVMRAREWTRRQSGHVRDPAAYAAYYAANQNERPFEEQFGLQVEEAQRFPRLAFLRGALAAMFTERPRLRVLDLAGHDGAFAANLATLPFPVMCDVVDLNPANCKRARERRMAGAASIGEVIEGDACAPLKFPSKREKVAHDPDRRLPSGRGYDAVVAFEVIEHVASPARLLENMLRYAADDGYLFLSTPCGVDHGGNLPNWDDDQPKGHVRVYVEDSFRAELGQAGEIVQFMTGPDRVMVAQIKPSG